MSVTVGQRVAQVRSKNAGPFWVTIDVFCGNDAVFKEIDKQLTTDKLAEVLQQQPTAIKRFSIPSLHVVKFSLPRPVVQGHRTDRDMHGAQWAVLIAEMSL